MIYLDVTCACRSVQNTGMPRVTRKIFAELQKSEQVHPVCWNDMGRCYQELGTKERRFLERPFDVSSRAISRPELRGANFFVVLYRLLTRPRIALEKRLGEGDVFLVPDSFHNTRRKILPKLLQKTPARKVAIFHDAANLRLPHLFQERGNKVRRYIESLSIFDLVVCVSREAEHDLHRFWKEYGREPAPTVVERWPAELSIRAADQREADRKIIVYVSSLARRKNHATLLRAAEKLWSRGVSFELWLVGRNTRHFNSAVRQIRLLQRRDRPLQWLRHVNEETLLRAYDRCFFTVYPSLLEGFGLPIVESLLHGKPCICGDNGALGEVASGGGCLIVDQTDVNALSDGMERLLQDRQLYARLCSEARARVFRSWPDYIDNLLGHLETRSHVPSH